MGTVAPMSIELSDLYSGALAFVMAGVGEGLPNVFIEAAAFGISCVGVDDGGTPEIVIDGETGFLARADDEVSLAACLDRLLEDEGGRQEMGRRGRRLVESRFSAEALAERSYEVLRHTVESRRAAGGRA